MLLHDRYTLEEELGYGNQGTTWRALDTKTGEHVAIKSLYMSRAADWKAIELFEREVETLRAINHVSIPSYIDSFSVEKDGEMRLYLVQQFVEGRNLKTCLETQGRFTAVQIKAILVCLLKALESLHRRVPPIVHRDIKPSNILQTPQGDYVLIDFGAVQVASQSSVGGSTVIGTPGFMPLEQLIGRAEPASDFYSLGVALCTLWTGVSPTQVPMRDNKLLYEDLLPMDTVLARVLVSMLAPSVEQRPSSSADLLATLSQAESSTFPIFEPPEPSDGRETREAIPSDPIAHWHQRALFESGESVLGFEVEAWEGPGADLKAFKKWWHRAPLRSKDKRALREWEPLGTLFVKAKTIPAIPLINVDGIHPLDFDAFQYYRSPDGATLFREHRQGLCAPRLITFMESGQSVVTSEQPLGSGAVMHDVRTVKKTSLAKLIELHQQEVDSATKRGEKPLFDVPSQWAYAWEKAARLPSNLSTATTNHGKVKNPPPMFERLIFWGLCCVGTVGLVPLILLLVRFFKRREYHKRSKVVESNNQWRLLPPFAETVEKYQTSLHFAEAQTLPAQTSPIENLSKQALSKQILSERTLPVQTSSNDIDIPAAKVGMESVKTAT